MYKKILVPLDGSALAEAVLPHAQALAKSEGGDIPDHDGGQQFSASDP